MTDSLLLKPPCQWLAASTSPPTLWQLQQCL